MTRRSLLAHTPPTSTTTPPTKAPTDELAAAVHALVTILGAAGVISALGLTADEVAVLLSGLMTVAAIVRATWLRLHPPALPPVQPAAPAPAGEGGGAK